MVKESNKSDINFYGIEFNPIENLEENLPEIVVLNENDNMISKKIQIARYNDFLKYEINKREQLVQTYKKYEWGFLIFEIIFFLLELSVITVGLIIPDIIIKTSIVGMVLTTVSTSIRKIYQYILKNASLYRELLVLTKSKLLHFETRYNIALSDNEITQEEYISLIEEFKKFEKLRSNILLKKS